ncbi:MAG TPA: PKD domain-containing protein [Solirubrobacteraceae bacterium]|nr:PKD domain-containing protein [Solirubrobacteraceae bacterium]
MRQRRTTDRRPGISPGRRLCVVLALAAAACAVTGDVAAADDASGPIVSATIHEQGGATVEESASLSQLQQCPEYSSSSMVEYGRQGPVPVDFPPPGPQTGAWSLGSALGCLQPAIPSASVTGIVVMGSDDTPEEGPGSELTPADLASPSDFANTAENPVISANGSTVAYDRPWRGSSDEDFLDEVQEAPPVTLDVFEGPMLNVNASASSLTVPAGTTVTFTTQVSGNDGSPLTYDWNFGSAGPANSSAPSPQETFSVPGTYAVTLAVTDADGGGGGSTLSLTVTGGGNPNGNAPTGPTRSPSKQAGSGSHKHPAGGHSGKTGTQTTQKSTHSETSTTPTTASTTTAATTTSTASTAATTQTTPPAKPHRPARTTHRAASHPAPPPEAPIVRGRLVSDIVTLPAASSPLVHEQPVAAAVAPAVRAPRSRSALAGAAAALVVVLLLGLGAGRELRGRRRWRSPHVGG